MFWKKKDKTFFDFFKDHAKQIQAAAELWNKMLIQKKGKQELYEQIKKVEHLGDGIARNVFKEVNCRGFILPLDHDDIFRFTKTLDDVLDQINETAEAYADIFELQDASPYALRFSEIILKGAENLVSVCSYLDHISAHSNEILNGCVQLHIIENEGDMIRQEALHVLFMKLKKGEIPACDYISWENIYRNLEIVTDKLEDCADICEQFVLKYS